MSTPRVLRVLVVDDSAYVRKVVSQLLSRSPFLEVVGTARDGHEALEKAAELEPDVITCDLIMPNLDGLGFVREQMMRRPVPIVIVSVASESGELVLNALDAGAVDVVQKPTALASERLMEISDELIAKVKAAAEARLRRPALTETAKAKSVPQPFAPKGVVDIVVLGISTGGPQALRALIPRLPAELSVPLAVVLHMPVGYTELYARKLDELSSLSVVEASEGLEVRPGSVLIAPAGRHLSMRRAGDGSVTTHLDVRPLDTPHRPSVDVLFQSAADVYAGRVLGVVMTGMGSDGREGSAWIKAKGGRILTESEESCVVYGMPRSVVEAGLSDRSVTLDRMADAILEQL
jgi:two-component system, chemotaxis family, protein-glutamate methylesterase/glutaminase